MFCVALLKKLVSLGQGRRNARAGGRPEGPPAGRLAVAGRIAGGSADAFGRPHRHRSAELPDSRQLRPGRRVVGQGQHQPGQRRGSGPTGTVEFLDTLDGSTAAPTVLGTVNVANWNSAAHLNVATLPLGSNSITAIYTPPSGSTAFAGSTSAPVVETVTAAASRTTVLATGNPIVSGAAATFTAVVAGAFPSVSGSTQATAISAGTVTFTIDAGTANATTATVTQATTSGGNALYQFTTASPLTAGTHSILATYSGDTDYNTSTSATLSVQVMPEVDGTVTVGSPATLRGGQRSVTVNVSETAGVLGGTLAYSDSYRGINLSNVVVDSLVFSSNGHQAEISGTADNNSSTSTVAFAMIVDQGSGSRFSQPTVSMEIVGSGIDYVSSGSVNSGTVTVNGTGSSTIPRLGGGWGGSSFDGIQRAVQSFFDDFGSALHDSFGSHAGFGSEGHGHFGCWRF